MQGVLATVHLSGSLDRVVLRNDLLPAPCDRRTVVPETEIIGDQPCLHWSITGRNNHSDRRQKFD